MVFLVRKAKSDLSRGYSCFLYWAGCGGFRSDERGFMLDRKRTISKTAQIPENAAFRSAVRKKRERSWTREKSWEPSQSKCESNTLSPGPQRFRCRACDRRMHGYASRHQTER